MTGLPKFSSKNKKKSRCHLQIIGATRVTESKFHTKDLQFGSDLQTSSLSGALCSVYVIYTHLRTRKENIKSRRITFCRSGDLAPENCALLVYGILITLIYRTSYITIVSNISKNFRYFSQLFYYEVRNTK